MMEKLMDPFYTQDDQIGQRVVDQFEIPQETVTNCNRLKLQAGDEKMQLKEGTNCTPFAQDSKRDKLSHFENVPHYNMRKLKDSGIPWIGLIPEDWEIRRIKNLYAERTELTETGDEELLSVSEYYGIAPTKEKTDNEFISRADSLIGYKKCFSGDFISNIMLAWKGSFGTSNYDGIVSPAYCVYKPISSISSKYYHYLFRTDLFKSVFRLYSKGIIESRLRLYSPYFLAIETIVPPLKEQERIATWLDGKCGEIDELIEVEQQMISELEAYRQAVISEAVTHGLNSDCEMVQSGCEWFSYHPKQWSTEKIKSLFKKRSEKNNPIKTKERLSLSIDKGITLYADKTTNLDRFKDDFTQYQLAYTNDIVLNSMNMIVGAVGKSSYYGCVSPVYYVIYGKNQYVDMDYYGFLLNIPAIRSVYHKLGKGIYAIERGDGRVNTCRLKVDYYEFSQIKVPFPPLNEQKQIASYLKDKMQQIDSLIKIKQEKIETLKQYRQSLIFEAVTGKITLN